MLDVALLERSGKRFFYFEQSAPVNPSQHNREQEERRHLSRIKRTLKKGYQTLEAKLPIEERLCSHLRRHDHVKLYVPSHVSSDAATKLFLSFLKNCVKTHRRWLLADGVLAAMGAALVWIPGPNVFFFYPAFRALGHYYAQAGGGKHGEPSSLIVLPCALLDDFPNLPVPEMMARSREIERRFGFNQLVNFLGEKYASQ